MARLPLGARLTRGDVRRSYVPGEARGTSLGQVKIEIVGLKRAAQVPDLLQKRFEEFMVATEDRLTSNLQKFVPGGPGGRIGQSVYSARTARGRILIGIAYRPAIFLNYGFTSVPKRKKVLSWVNEHGERVFSTKVKVRGRFFWERTVGYSKYIVRDEYHRHFHDLHHHTL